MISHYARLMSLRCRPGGVGPHRPRTRQVAPQLLAPCLLIVSSRDSPPVEDLVDFVGRLAPLQRLNHVTETSSCNPNSYSYQCWQNSNQNIIPVENPPGVTDPSCPIPWPRTSAPLLPSVYSLATRASNYTRVLLRTAKYLIPISFPVWFIRCLVHGMNFPIEADR